MIYDVCSCIAKRRSRIVSIGHNPDIRKVLQKEVFEPECLRLAICPSVRLVSVESMDGDDADSNMLACLISGDSGGYRG